jgi:hypothetical protein
MPNAQGPKEELEEDGAMLNAQCSMLKEEL